MIPTPPGTTIQNIIDEHKLSYNYLARKLKISPVLLVDIIKGKAPITDRLARKLEEFTNIQYEFWMTRQKNYRDYLEGLKKNE